MVSAMSRQVALWEEDVRLLRSAEKRCARSGEYDEALRSQAAAETMRTIVREAKAALKADGAPSETGEAGE